MTKIVLNPVNRPETASGTQIINDNFNKIVNAIDNTVSRDGSSPNNMNADIDLNSNDLLNVGNIDVQSISVNGSDEFNNTLDNIIAITEQAKVYRDEAGEFANDAEEVLVSLGETIEDITPDKFEFVGDGVTDTYDLGQELSVTGVDVYVNGEYIYSDKYTIVGTTVVLDTPPPAPTTPGDKNVSIRVGAQASIATSGVPALNSVGTGQLQNLAVTNAKLAGNITIDKLDTTTVDSLRDLSLGTGIIPNGSLPARLRENTSATPIDDWNNAVASGWYVNGDAANQINGPETNKRFMGEVISFNTGIAPNAGWQRQRVYEFSTNNPGASNTRTWQRERFGTGAWNAWYRVEDSLTALDARYGAGSSKRTMEWLTFYRDPQTPLTGTSDAGNWLYPGNATSASTARWRGDMGFKIATARWIVVWTPGNSSTSSGVRLCWADDGPSNITEFARINGNNATTPVTAAVDITSALNSMTVNKQILHQTLGNGSAGVQIYSSVLEIVWDTA